MKKCSNIRSNRKYKIEIIIILLSIIAYLIVGTKFNSAYRYGILFITILSGAVFFSDIFKKKIEQTLILSITLIMLILYIFGLLGILKIGAYVAIILNLLMGLITLIKVIFFDNSKKDKSDFIKFLDKLYSPGIIIYTLLFMLFAITTRNRVSYVWDEFTFWSIANKNMYYLNDFVTNAKSTLTTITYPPMPTIMQYFFCKVIGKYSQGIEIFTLDMIVFACLINVFANLKKKNVISIICSLAIIIFLPTIFCRQILYETPYVDSILGFLIGYIIYEFFVLKDDLFKWISLICASIILALTKPTGIVILLIVCTSLELYFLIKFIVKAKNTQKNKKELLRNLFKSKTLYLIITMLFVGSIAYGSWQLHVKSSKTVEEYQEIYKEASYDANPIKYTLVTFLKAFFTGYSEFSYNMNQDINSVGNMAEHFFDKTYYSKVPFNMSVTTWLVIFVLGMVAIYKLIIEKNEKKKFLIYSICQTVGFGLYLLFLQVAYIIMFSNREGILHKSVQRYIGTYLIAIAVYLVFTFINYLNTGKIKYSKSKFVAVTAIVMLFTPMKPVFDATITSGYYNRIKQDEISFHENAANKVKEIIDENDKVYPINQTANIDSHGLRFRYFMTPYFTANIEIFSDEDLNITLDEWKEILYNNYQYVYVISSDEYFIENYNLVFEDEIKDWSLYKIDKTNGQNGLKLTLMEEYK